VRVDPQGRRRQQHRRTFCRRVRGCRFQQVQALHR
jgi:hypothetical protein